MISPEPREHSRGASPAPRTYTAEQAADIIGCKASWLKRLARERKISYEWIGGSYKFTAAQIEAIIAFCEVPAKAAPDPAKSAPTKRKADAKPVPLFPLTPAGTVQLRARAPRKQGAA